MSIPRSVTKVSRDGSVTFTSSVDKIEYTINELMRAALRDTAKMLRKRMLIKLRRLPGMKRNKRVYWLTQTWVRRRETDLQIGFGNSSKTYKGKPITGDSWYGIKQELGTSGQPKRSILRGTVYESISEIRRIHAQYISAINNEQRALSNIDESESLNEEGGS